MAASGILKKGHNWQSFAQKYLKITLFLEKRALFCQILQGAASDYRILISFALFHDHICHGATLMSEMVVCTISRLSWSYFDEWNGGMHDITSGMELLWWVKWWCARYHIWHGATLMSEMAVCTISHLSWSYFDEWNGSVPDTTSVMELLWWVKWWCARYHIGHGATLMSQMVVCKITRLSWSYFDEWNVGVHHITSVMELLWWVKWW